MKVNIVQKIQIWLVRQVINVIWYIDLATGYPLNQSVQFASKPFVFVSLILVGVLTYFIYIPFLLSFNTKSLPVSLNAYEEVPVVLGATESSDSESLQEKPLKSGDSPFPEVTARAVLVVDSRRDKVLYERNSEKKYASASTTKLMTALVALNIYSLDDSITMTNECASVESTKAGLVPGEVYSVEQLLRAMLVASAGDAACLLGSGKIDTNEFLYLMNEKAYELGMKDTFFTNTIGLDGYNSSQFSSPEDLYLLAKATTSTAILNDIVALPQVAISSESGKSSLMLYNTNRLLSEIPYTVGIKTGTTVEAGEVFIYEYDDGTRDLVIIVMGSSDRFGETKKILEWTLASHTW